jgi:DNA-binding NarL/FixJ family response regulator
VPGPLRVLVVDDQSVFREGLNHVLSGCPDLSVVGAAWPPGSIWHLVGRAGPDIVVLDPAGRQSAGSDVDGIARAYPQVGVLVLTAVTNDQDVYAVLRAGARGYLLKDTDAPDLIAAIRTVAGGGAVFGSAVAGRLRDYLTGTVAHSAFPGLTEREHRLLDLLAAGRSNLDIAQRLGLSPKTVRNRVSAIFAKIHVADRGQAIVRAREAGLGRRDAGPPHAAIGSRILPAHVGTAGS